MRSIGRCRHLGATRSRATSHSRGRAAIGSRPDHHAAQSWGEKTARDWGREETRGADRRAQQPFEAGHWPPAPGIATGRTDPASQAPPLGSRRAPGGSDSGSWPPPVGCKPPRSRGSAARRAPRMACARPHLAVVARSCFPGPVGGASRRASPRGGGDSCQALLSFPWVWRSGLSAHPRTSWVTGNCLLSWSHVV